MEYSVKSTKDLEYPPTPQNPSCWERLKLKLHRTMLISETHPCTMQYFKSELAILKEKKRHYENYRYSIHPLSKFNRFYEVWCFFFYGITLFVKTFDFALVTVSFEYPFYTNREIITIVLITDILSIANSFLQFWIGYTIEHLRCIELSKTKITIKYIVSGHFCCDLFSSVPRVFSYRSTYTIYLLTLTLTLLKLRRVTTFVRLIKPTALFFGIKSNIKMFLFAFFFFVALTFHLMACFHMGIPRYRKAILLHISAGSFVNAAFSDLPIIKRYMLALFKTARYTFLIDLPSLTMTLVTEEIIFCIINYIIGKMLMAIIWIVLLYTLITQRILKIKFEEIITELNEYMMAKQLPEDLKKRLLSYYTYKYQKIFFNETYIRSVLSENLKREIDVFLCKSLIKQVSIFSNISPKTMQQVVSYLVPQIYLPNDLIIQSATYGNCMYFIQSGTVAVFTPSGKEICHLQDGAYFGEISIVIKDQKRTASVVAIEISRVYKLKREHFELCFGADDQVYNDLLECAKDRIEKTKEVELKYKKVLFEQTYAKTFNNDLQV